ncbi:MAG: FHA domain-containing protein [Sporichthyaceae bacterium]
MTAPLEVAVAGRRVHCDGAAPVQIGRDPSCTVAIAHERVSRVHATVTSTPTGWFFQDSSSGGTWHQGNRLTSFAVSAPITVRLGDPNVGPELTLAPAQAPAYAGAAQPHAAPPAPSPVAAPSAPPPGPVAGPGLEIATVTGRHHLRAGGSATVGRDPSATVTIEDPRISREHLRIAQEGGAWVLTDGGSTGGTFLDGARVTRLLIDRPLALRLSHPDAGPLLSLTPTGGADDRLGPSIRSRAAGPSLVASVPIQTRVRVGRAPDNDVVVDDLTVSRYHAELRAGPAGYEIVDLNSSAGTFLNGARISRAPVFEGATVAIGRHLFVFSAGRLDTYVDDAAVYAARGLCFDLPNGRRLLDEISFVLEPGQLLAVLGPSGAGKSTLLNALTGFGPATSGQVGYNGRDLYSSLDELRYRIGYVPQDDILHTGLKLRQALAYSAELRFSDDTSPGERAARVDEVLHELGLAHRADLPMTQLSGGQRKRASVAVELLTRPSLLFLDEPTSGLDPGFERAVMQLTRELADGGRTVVVITHSVASLDLCDRVLVLAPGGRTAYFGPPSEALAYFGNADYPDVFVRLEREQRDWKADYRNHQAHRAYVDAPMAAAPPVTGPGPGLPYNPARTRRGAGVGRQLQTMVRRTVAVTAASRSNLILLLAQAPIMAVLLLAAVQVGNLKGAGVRVNNNGDAVPDFPGDPRILLMVLVLAAVAMGLINSVREIVKELKIYRRERTVGLSLTAYLGAKFLCLGALAAAQTFVLTVMVVLPQGGGPKHFFTLGFMVFLIALSTIALGLAISALVSSDSTALVLIPVLIVGQLIFCNAALEVENKPVLGQAAWLSQSYWGYAGSASAVDLRNNDAACARQQIQGRGGGGREASCSGLWKSGPGYYLIGVTGLLVLGGAAAGGSVLALRRRDPLRKVIRR